MIKRRKTKTIRVGLVSIGSSAPIVIQSMTKVPTVDVTNSLTPNYEKCLYCIDSA
jgi:4-hydroxy-3-methylbut-2-en-1-yl diphosphate synthase IspG/GcpE